MFHGNLQNTGLSPYDTGHVDGIEKWSFETGDGIESSPVIGADGTVYFGSHDGYLYAVNPDGIEKWRFDAGPPVYDERWDVAKSMMASPAIATDGTIYVYSSANYLFAVNPDGTEKWRFYLKWGNDFWSSPGIGPDGTIYIGSARSQGDPDFDGGLHAINPDGTEKWLFSDDSGVTSSAAIGEDGTIYFGGNVLNPHGEGNIGKLYALNPDGMLEWEFTTENWMESSPAIGPDGTIYVGSGREGKIYALNPNGAEKWHFQAEVGVSAVPAIGADGTIYIGAWDAHFFALNPDGTEKWRYKTPDAFEGVSSSAAIGADGTIYVGSNSGSFYAFNPDGTVKWNFEAQGPVMVSPAIDYDGTLYFGSWDRKLYALGRSRQGGTNTGQVTSPPEEYVPAGPDPEFDNFTWTLPADASPLRLSLPADIEDFLFTEHGGIGGFGLHAGGHIEGLDHVWIELKPGTPVKSWADGVVQDVRYQGPPGQGEYHITIDYGHNLVGIHMEIMTPYVAKGERVSRGQEVGMGMSFDPHQSSAEQSLIDMGRTDGVKAWGGGVFVSPFDYLEREDKIALIETYRKQVIEPYKRSGKEMWGFQPYQPYLTNNLFLHQGNEGRLSGAWYLISSDWEYGYPNDLLTFIEADNPYFQGNVVRAMDDADASSGDWSIKGTFEVDYAKGQIKIKDEYGATYFGIFEIDESGERAILKIEYREGSYPDGFSDEALIYLQRSDESRRGDAAALGILKE
jgi:outer membrane protein assembly factor BamB